MAQDEDLFLKVDDEPEKPKAPKLPEKELIERQVVVTPVNTDL
jgi:hypothetical protein